MNRTTWYFIIIVTLIISTISGIFITPFVAARLATLPFIRNWHLYDPQAPIVINRTEVIRSDDNEDIITSISKIKDKLAAVISVKGGEVTYVANALVVSSDGLLVTVQAGLVPGNPYQIMLPSGELLAPEKIDYDPATDIAFIKVPARTSSIAGFSDSASLPAGQRLVFVSQTIEKYVVEAEPALVTKPQILANAQSLKVGRFMRTFGVNLDRVVIPGATAVTASGDVAGLWSPAGVIASDVLASRVQLYITEPSRMKPVLSGATYLFMGAVQNQINGRPLGALITAVDQAALAGVDLKTGDTITSIDGQPVTSVEIFEKKLESLRADEPVTLIIDRGGKVLTRYINQ